MFFQPSGGNRRLLRQDFRLASLFRRIFRGNDLLRVRTVEERIDVRLADDAVIHVLFFSEGFVHVGGIENVFGVALQKDRLGIVFSEQAQFVGQHSIERFLVKRSFRFLRQLDGFGRGGAHEGRLDRGIGERLALDLGRIAAKKFRLAEPWHVLLGHQQFVETGLIQQYGFRLRGLENRLITGTRIVYRRVFPGRHAHQRRQNRRVRDRLFLDFGTRPLHERLGVEAE